MRVQIKIERDEDGELRYIDVAVIVDEGVVARYAREQGLPSHTIVSYELTDDERDRARDAWERLE